MTLFPILLEVEETHLGPVLRALNGMPGVAKLHLDLDNVPKKAGRQPGRPPMTGVAKTAHKGRPEGGPRAQDVLISALLSGPKSSLYLSEQYTAHGFVVNGMAPLISKLKDKGIVEKAPEGGYQLTAAAMAELNKGTNGAATPQLPAPAFKGHSRVKPGMGPVFVAAQIRQHDGSITREQLRSAGAQVGMTPKSVEGTLARMKRAKLLTTTGKGVFALTAKGNRTLAVPEQPAETTNGEDHLNG